MGWGWGLGDGFVRWVGGERLRRGERERGLAGGLGFFCFGRRYGIVAGEGKPGDCSLGRRIHDSIFSGLSGKTSSYTIVLRSAHFSNTSILAHPPPFPNSQLLIHEPIFPLSGNSSRSNSFLLQFPPTNLPLVPAPRNTFLTPSKEAQTRPLHPTNHLPHPLPSPIPHPNPPTPSPHTNNQPYTAPLPPQP